MSETFLPDDIWLVLRDHVQHVGGKKSDDGRGPWQGAFLRASGMADYDYQGGLPLYDEAKGLPQGFLYWTEVGPKRVPSSANKTVTPDEAIDYVGAWANVFGSHTAVFALPEEFGPDALATALPLRDQNFTPDDWYDPLRIQGFEDDPNPPKRGTGAAPAPPPVPTSPTSATTVAALPASSTPRGGGRGTGGTSGRTRYHGQFKLNEEHLAGRVTASPLPSFWPTLWVGGTERASLHPLGYPAWTNLLISDYESPKSDELTFSTRLADLVLEQDGKVKIDPDRTATIASALRVVGVIDREGRSTALSWGLVPGNNLKGRGQFISHGWLANTGLERSSPDLLAAIAYAADSGGGPISIGAGRIDIHRVGVDQDAVAHVAGHLDLRAPWFLNSEFDAPPEHGGLWQRPVMTGGGVWKTVYLRWDPDRNHRGAGEGFAERTYPGLHRWQVPTFIFIPDLPDPPPDGDLPPPLPPVPPRPPRFPPLPPEDPPPPDIPPITPRRPRDPFTPVTPIPRDGDITPADPDDLFREPGGFPAGEEDPFSEENLREDGRRFPLANQVVRPGRKQDITDILMLWMELATAGILFRPSLHGKELEGDLRLIREPSEGDIKTLLDQPVVGRLEPFGAQNGREWQRASLEASADLYHYGTTPGGVSFMPGNRDIECSNEVNDLTVALFNLWQGKATDEQGATKLTFGTPHQTGPQRGLVTDGYAITMETDDLVLENLGAVGDATVGYRFNALVSRYLGTGALGLHAGTTAERPGTPAAGYFRFNADTGLPEYYDGAAWFSISGGAPGEPVPSVEFHSSAETLDFDTLNLTSSSGGAFTLTLPDASGEAGRRVIVKDSDGSSSGANKVTISSASGESIDGGSTSVTLAKREALTFRSDGTNWVLT